MKSRISYFTAVFLISDTQEYSENCIGYQFIKNFFFNAYFLGKYF